ncbi:putative cilia- and flagella-associated protein 52-like 3, partial [Homarus americanus]
IQTLVVLPGGDLLVGDLGGSLRAYRQLPDVKEDGRPVCAGPPRAHGTVKYTHPKDPTRPLLAQLWSLDVGATVTSVSVVGREVVLGTINSEMFQVHLPAPTTHQPSSRVLPLYKTNGCMRKANNSGNSESVGSKNTDKKNNKRLSRLSDRLQEIRLDVMPLEAHLLSTCHSEPIYDVTFP